MKEKFNSIKAQIDSLSVFCNIKNDEVINRFRTLLDSASKFDTDENCIKIYSDFISTLYPNTVSLTEYIRNLIIQDDNFYVKNAASKIPAAEEIQDAVRHELKMLDNIASVTSQDIQTAMEYKGFLPSWKTEPSDFTKDFFQKLENLPQTGYGIFAQYSFFRLDNEKIVPVTHPDYQSADKLFGYERERNLIIKNTEALVNGTGSSNMLLYGDAGTGKSSTIKAVAAMFAPNGLRIIEVKKNQLYRIPEIMEQLASNPLKFILFIDDLSFTGNDDNFSALKATLEGSISGCGDNVVIYATSNRRHLIKETFSERTGDELHINDTLQETMSLAARFGLTITFQKPDPDEYLNIVKSLAKEYGIEMDEEECKKAEAYAIRKNGRSPRTAKQFIELLKIGI